MKPSTTSLFLLFLLLCVCGVLAEIKDAHPLNLVNDKKFIVQLSVHVTDTAGVTLEQTNFLKALDLLGVPYKVITQYTLAWNAIFLEINVDKHLLKARLELIDKIAGVVNIFPEQEHTFQYELSVSTGPRKATGKRLKRQDPPNVDQSITSTEPAVSKHYNGYAADPLSALKLTGVHTIHQTTKLAGTGIKVGILDTGIDYEHPTLGGCFGPGCRVAYGYDFVGDDGNTPGPRPLDKCHGHGTHCAGIIGGMDPDGPFRGVAYNVTFGAYRIMSCTSGASDSVVINAIEMAMKDGMDILSMSFGAWGWAESATAAAASSAAEHVAVVVAVGNDGDKGIWTSGAPSVGYQAISVASINNYVISEYYMIPDIDSSYLLSYQMGINGSKPAVIDTRPFPVIDITSSCPNITMNVTGKIVLQNLAECSKLDITNGQPVAILMYTADTDSKYIWSAQTTFDGVPLITLRNTDGEWLAQELKSHPEIKLTFSQEQKAFPMVHPGKPSPFSSYGISPDLDLKPDIAAPGAKILSTFPLNFGGWAQDQGTSMACPYVAGAVALLLEKYGKMPTSAIRSLLLNTADPMTMDDRQIYPVPKQGSGLLNIIDALNVRTLITPTKYALNNDSKLTAIDERQNFTIYNMAPTTVKYAISHLPAASLTGYNGSDPRPLSTVTLSNVTATITFAVTSVTIPPNGHAVVNWNIQPPNLDPAGHWFYSGFIYVKPDSDEGVQTIPYAAVLTTGLVNVLSQERGYPSLQYPKNDSTTISASSADDTISLKLFTDNPTRLLLVGVLSEDNETDYGCALYLSYFARTAQPIPITFYPFEVGTCDSEQQSELLPNGNYRLYVSAVKMFGNLARTEDYEVWISPPFTIERVNETSTDVLPTFTDVLPTSTDVLPTSTDALPVPSPTASDPHSNK